MCCSSKVSKCILIVFNTIFFILGAACLVAGVLVILDKSVLTSTLGKIPNVGDTLDQALSYTSYLQFAAYIIIGAGAAVFIIAFCGCIGAIKDSRCLLVVYAVLVFLILGVQIAAGVVGYLYKDQATNYMRSFLQDTISQKYQGLSIDNGALSTSIEPYSAAWDVAMISLECCGNYNYSDFNQYATQWSGNYSYGGYNLTGAKVPIACCKVTDKTALISDLSKFATYFTNSTQCLTNADPLYTNTATCYDRIIYLVNTYTLLVFGIGVGVGAVELFGIIAACCLIQSIGKSRKVEDF